MGNPVVTYRRDGNVGIITADNPPVNALGHAVREGLMAALAEAEADTGAAAIVIACAGRTFFAGADISEFGKPSVRPVLGEVIDRLETCTKPVVAALHGTACFCCVLRVWGSGAGRTEHAPQDPPLRPDTTTPSHPPSGPQAPHRS